MQARDVSGGVHFHHRRASGQQPTPRQLPGDVRGFVNRTVELERLNAIVSDEAGEPLVVSVCVIAGTAGAGKTSLALHWAHQAQGRFPDGQLYVNLRGYDPGRPVRPEEALHRFLVALGVPPREVAADPDAAAALYRSHLADRRMLIVLDNAATAAQVRPLLPGGPGNLTIVTSRNRLSGLAIRDGAQRLTLGTLPEPEAVALLRSVTAGYRPADDAGKLVELARLCARLPLALRIAAERAASHPHMRLDDLIADLRDESALWDALSTGEENDADGIRTVFAWSYRALPEPAARLFRLLGLHPGPDISLRAAAALAASGLAQTRQRLDILVGAHLLEQTAPDRYAFHDLLRAYATGLARGDEPPEERAAAVRRVLAWYLHSADASRALIEPAEPPVPAGPPPPDVTPVAFPDFDAAVDWTEREHANLLAAARAAAGGGGADDALAWRLSVVHWIVWSRSSPVTEWLEAARLGLDAARRLGDVAAQAWLLECMGEAHTMAFRLAEAEECHAAALELRRASGDRRGEALSLNALGLVRLRRRRLREAAERFDAALTAFRAAGGHPYWEATVLANLAGTHYRAGRLDEAATAATAALAAHRALGDRDGEANDLRVLSDIHRERDEPAEALDTARQALDLALALRDHVLEGFLLLTLGAAQTTAGQPGDALESYHRAATLHRRLGDRSREALAWHGTAEAYAAMDRHDEATTFHRQAAAAHRTLDDPWHEALSLSGLATALHPTDPDAAHAHRSEALRLLAAYDDPRAAALRERIERDSDSA